MSILEDWRERIVYTIIPNRAVTELILQECAELFSHHYGKWSSKIEHKDLVPVPGAPIRMKPSKLKTDYLLSRGSKKGTTTVRNSVLAFIQS